MEWFEDSELDAHLNEHIGFKGSADSDEEPKRRPGRRGEFLGGASGLLGFVTAFVLSFLFGSPRCDGPCPEIPLSTELFIILLLCGSMLGLMGASTVGRHWKAGTIGLLIGGVLPLISIPGVLVTEMTNYGPADFCSVCFLFSFLVFLGWAPLLILAGVLAASDSPGKRAKQISGVGLLKKTA